MRKKCDTGIKICEYLILILIVMAFILLLGHLNYLDSLYNIDGIVLDKDGSICTIRDVFGYIWEYNDDSVEVGDKVILKMYDNLTPGYEDDDEIRGMKKIVK